MRNEIKTIVAASDLPRVRSELLLLAAAFFCQHPATPLPSRWAHR